MDTPYGDYSEFDLPVHWTENFTPTEKVRRMCTQMIDSCIAECAELCGLDTDNWDIEDWCDFREIMEI